MTNLMKLLGAGAAEAEARMEEVYKFEEDLARVSTSRPKRGLKLILHWREEVSLLFSGSDLCSTLLVLLKSWALHSNRGISYYFSVAMYQKEKFKKRLFCNALSS